MSAKTLSATLAGYHFEHMKPGDVHWAIESGRVFSHSQPDSVIYHREIEVTVDVPDDLNIVAAQVSALERKKEQALADYQRTVAEINDRLSKLQAITCDEVPS